MRRVCVLQVLPRRLRDVLLGWIPCPTKWEAERIGKTLVSENLAACANVLPRMSSFFIWEGKLRTVQECLLLLKVLKKNRVASEKRILQLHSYDVPLIAFFEADSVNDAYLAWAEKP